MNYDQIKGALREADRCVQDGALSLADSMIREILACGGTVHDVHSNLSEGSLKALRDWSRNDG